MALFKKDNDKLSGFARNPISQSFNQIHQYLRQLLAQKPRTEATPLVLHLTYERPSKRETPRFARSLIKVKAKV